MANEATINVQATVLPDEIAKMMTGSTTIAPADADDKWYYKKTSVANSSQDLIAGDFIEYTSVDSATGATAVDAADLVNFLFIKNLDDTNDVYIVLDGSAVTTASTTAIKVAAGHVWFGNLPNTTVADIHAITSASTVDCLVAALLDDVA